MQYYTAFAIYLEVKTFRFFVPTCLPNIYMVSIFIYSKSAIHSIISGCFFPESNVFSFVNSIEARAQYLFCPGWKSPT